MITRSWRPARSSSGSGSGRPWVTRSWTPSATSGASTGSTRTQSSSEGPARCTGAVVAPESSSVASASSGSRAASRTRSTGPRSTSPPSPTAAAPADGEPGRLAWTAKQDGTPAERLDVLHAWLVEDLPGGRVRILTQETQTGEPAAALAEERPDPMLSGHQAWLDGLVRAARR